MINASTIAHERDNALWHADIAECFAIDKRDGESALPCSWRQMVYAEVYGRFWIHRWNKARIG